MDHDQLILKHLNGTITDVERQMLDEWINESEQNKKLLDDLTLMWKLSKDKITIPDFQTEQEWAKLESSISRDIQGAKVRKLPRLGALKIAAAITLIALCSSVLYLLFFKHNIILKESGNSIVHVALPDGSSVWLNAYSSLSYSENFNEKDRIVNLDGEGFFEVKRDAEKAFVVQTSQAQVKVLGTSFNVSSYQSKNLIEVFVATGVVSFFLHEDNTSGLTLKPGETGILKKNNNVITRSPEDNLNALAWKEQKLNFRKTPVGTVLKNLETYFKINVRIKNQDIAKCRFTGSFDKPELDEIIEALSVSLDLTITKDSGNYVVTGDGC
jgi:ferric-dicitrate binding protein FerR (iron transport regulator)